MNDKGSAGILKYLGEDIKRHPENRCVSTDQCIDKVLKGSSVYIFVIQSQFDDSIGKDINSVINMFLYNMYTD